MSHQPLLDWDADASLPVAGRSPRSRSASHSGAVRASTDRGTLSVAYLNLLRVAGPRSDQEAAKALGRETCSINSTRNGLGDLVVASDQFEHTPFNTRRVRWQVKQGEK